MDVLQFVYYSLIERHLGCFQFLATMSKAAMNICVQAFVDRYFDFSWVKSKQWNCVLRYCIFNF